MAEFELDGESNAVWYLLLDAKVASEEQLKQAYLEHEQTGKAFTTVLYNNEIITEAELLQLIAENLGTEVVDIKGVDITHEMIEKVTADIARMYGILPLYEEGDTLVLAAKDAMNYRMIDELHYVLGQECRILVSQPSSFDDALDHFYPQEIESVDDVLKELQESGVGQRDNNEEEEDEAALEAMAANAPIVRFVDVILYQAIKDQASDIHFEPFAEEFRIRYRIDGALYEMAPPPKNLAIPVISRIKVMAHLNTSEKRFPQDGRIELRIKGKPIDLRVSTMPTQYGESVVLRILDRSVVNLDLDSLGMESQMVEDLKEVIKQPNGIVIITGPTGSGKTTTLYSCLKEINTITEKLLTTEDPVEYDLEGIMQVQVNEAVGMTFAAGLRAFLRQDPDRIMVGEVRDVETAGMAIEAALTGHLVLTTLHTNDAPGAVTRLVDMGIEPFLISSTIIGVLAQRLIRRVCADCKVAYVPEDQELEDLGLKREDIGDLKFYHGAGCEKCNNSGYKGRIGIFELLKMSSAIEDLINERKSTLDIKRQAIKEGMKSMRECGLRAVLSGIATSEEVLKYT
jgi:type IV pilus assembly protein PilB